MKTVACLACLPAVLVLESIGQTALAGGGPENVLLVVNANSRDSMTIANHWVRLRSIPDANVVYLDWRPLFDNCQGQVYVDEILTPVIEAIGRRNLDAQIDYIVYSSDFPWRVDLRDLVADDRGKAAQPIASLTGATYLWRLVHAKSPAVTSLVSNSYAARGQHAGVGDFAPTRAFRSRYQWDASGERVESGAQYVLSTMLAVTTGRGNTVEEALDYLERAALADATHPHGTFYFLKNSDVRSKTRHNLFAEVVLGLRKWGKRAEIAEGILPQQKNDVMGLMTGTREFDLSAASTSILPGAICDHLTSFGGIMKSDAHHTPLSEFLRHGAAGATGTVTEPFAIQQKFPRPDVHLHYARGASLAEALYQSVSGPYQLLIVGDPLCQPFTIRPRVEVDGVEAGQTVQGTVALAPEAVLPEGREIARFELFLDGHLVDFIEPGQRHELDTTGFPDGYHELRIVAIESSPLEFQGRLIVPVWVDNHGGEITLEIAPPAPDASAGAVKLRAVAPGASSILVLQHQRTVGRIDGQEGSVELSAETLGEGPVSLRAVAFGSRPVISTPVWARLGGR
jgi:uncharacterized protein (TIGR03790 family)